VILIITALIALVEGCALREKTDIVFDRQKERIGIISAMDSETELLLEEAKIDHVDTIGGIDYNVGKLHGQDVVITGTGIGKVLSASATAAMLNNFNITEAIFTGIAGGVEDETKVLDEVIGTKLVYHDYGTITKDGFKWTTGNTGEMVGKDGYFFCDEELVDLAYASACEVLGEEHVFKGVIATGDQYIASEEYVDYLDEKFDAKACEMEGAAIGAVCTQYETPFVILRAMSDKADGQSHESFDNMGDIAADNSARIVMHMLDSMQAEK
jgi:adenosylhomocysteine nucleosidase